MSVKRYFISRVREDDGLVGIYEIGDREQFVTSDVPFVLASDYDALAAKLTESEKFVIRNADAVDALQREVERLRKALESFFEKFEQRQAAYPLDVFPEPTFSIVHAALKDRGLSTDVVSASNFRWMLHSIAKDLGPIRAALSPQAEKEQGV